MMRSIRHIGASLLLLAWTLAAQSWEPVPDLPVAVAAGQAVVHGDCIYVISGYSDSLAAPAPLLQIYHPEEHTWQVQPLAEGSRYGFYLLANPDRCYWGGGLAETPAALQQLLTWDFLSSPVVWQSHPLFERAYAPAFLFDNTLYLIGGYDPSGQNTFPYITGYDLLSRQVTFQDSTTFPGQVPYQQQAAVADGRICIFGGVYNSVMNRIYCFDPATATLKRLFPNMLYPRAAGQAVAVPERGIYLLGGYNETQAALSTVEIAHLQAETIFTELGPALRSARREPMTALYKEFLYVFGGRNQRGETIRAAERLFVGNATAVKDSKQQPHTADLANNYPNPFNSETCIPVSLQHPQTVRVDVVAADGRLVRVLADGLWPAGTHRLLWDGKAQDGRRVSAGVYFYRLYSANGVQVKRMLYLP